MINNKGGSRNLAGVTPLEKAVKGQRSLTGFTLVELIISGALVFVAAVTVYSVFNSGIMVWKKANEIGSYSRRLRLFSEKFSGELRNTFKFSTIPFEGTEESISFAALIDNQVGRLSYFLNEDNILCRQAQSYPEVFEKGENGRRDLLIAGITELKFSYCYLDNAGGEYKWKDEWVKGEQDTLPQAVKIELESTNKTGGQGEKFTKTVFLPIGTGEQKIDLGQ
ncbi:MAG: type II secretion system protein GspJ [Candidatus Omnitrophota bacterium]|jgi:hypothetical protein